MTQSGKDHRPEAGAAEKIKPWKELQPVFINTENVRSFLVSWNALDLARGKPRLMGICGKAGMGKSYCVTTHISRQAEEIPYLECLWVYAHSELEFLKALCRAVGVKDIPHRKAPCFVKVLEVLEAHPHRPLVVDDFHRLDQMPGHLEIMRDLTEMSGAPVVLIGEEKLEFMLKRQGQVASRTKQLVKFGPNQVADVVRLAREAAGCELSMEAAVRLHSWAKGDFRFVENAVAGCLQKAQAKGDARLDLADVNAVLKSLLAPLVEGKK